MRARQQPQGDEGFVLLLLLAVVVGMCLAGLGAVALVHAGSVSGQAPIQAPLITYDST